MLVIRILPLDNDSATRLLIVLFDILNDPVIFNAPTVRFVVRKLVILEFVAINVPMVLMVAEILPLTDMDPPV